MINALVIYNISGNLDFAAERRMTFTALPPVGCVIKLKIAGMHDDLWLKVQEICYDFLEADGHFELFVLEDRLGTAVQNRGEKDCFLELGLVIRAGWEPWGGRQDQVVQALALADEALNTV